MKKMGRRHRPFYRICAMDARQSRDGRVLEELGTYDPMVPEVDARAILNHERIQYWLSVGAQPTEKCKILIKKYGPAGTHLEKQREALARLAEKRRPQPAAQAGRQGPGGQPGAGEAEADAEPPGGESEPAAG
ncbi:MAG TPA: 30S ribosomal protein S16 [Planctomycetaceae bacterium]|nr:30S ribosomal protein S16 [Planctomycetaceae bacterium]